MNITQVVEIDAEEGTNLYHHVHSQYHAWVDLVLTWAKASMLIKNLLLPDDTKRLPNSMLPHTFIFL